MDTVTRLTIQYVCTICGVKYKTAEKARECESMPVEKQMFTIGETVTNTSPRICAMVDKEYIFYGKIVKIIAPFPADEEYELKWLGGSRSRLYSHVLQYQVEYVCPLCNTKESARYFTPEIRRVSK